MIVFSLMNQFTILTITNASWDLLLLIRLDL